MTALAGGLSGCLGMGDDAQVPKSAVTTRAATTTHPVAAPAAKKPRRRRTALARLVGQKFVVAYRDTTEPPPALLRRIERGEVGGVILFSDNVPRTGAAGIKRTVARLQKAARAGGNPPLLVATDQEGGDVRRMPGPPNRSPRELGRAPLPSVSSAGVATGRSLRAMGIGVDLAPVADAPAAASKSFLGTRAFGTAAQPRIRAAVAFAAGLQRAGVAATAKHYPGLGSSGPLNTDVAPVTLATPLAAMERERAGFVDQIVAGTRLVMVSNATYLAYDRARPAVVSPTIIGRLRDDGFRGVVVSDELRVPGLRRFGVQTAAAATRAGVDVLLFGNSGGEAEYRSLLNDVKAGRVRRRLVEQQVRRIVRLKRWIAAEASR